MKSFNIILLVVGITALVLSCNNGSRNPSNENDSNLIINHSDSSKRIAGEKSAKEQLDRFLSDSTADLLKGEILINDKQTLIKIVEPILFKGYGRENIINQRPYEIYLFGDYWIMKGTMPHVVIGGTFAIAINRKTCKVIGITHGK